MEEMEDLVKALMENKSFKERQRRLREAIDYLSISHPDVYSLLSRELKRRDVESNDPYRISKWINNSNSYIKLHESLILVKASNILAKEIYLDSLNNMMVQTIEKGTNIDVTVKICRLIEKFPHLKSIYLCLKDTIQLVYQQKKNEYSTNTNHLQLKSSLNENFQPIQDTHLKYLNIKCEQEEKQQSQSGCPSMLQPCNSKIDGSSSYFNYCLELDHLKMLATSNINPTFDILQSKTLLNLTIVDQGMDVAVSCWLHHLKLHKYQWFFNCLGYLEIESIHEDNIEGFIARVNKNTITKGAQKKICISTKTLRDRSRKLKHLLMALDLEVTQNELCEFTIYMREILHCPIPNKNCFVGDQLQLDIICVMEKLFNQLLEKLNMINYLVTQSLLRTSINTFLECSLLITGNTIFPKLLFEKMLILSEKLKYKVHQLPRNIDEN